VSTAAASWHGRRNRWAVLMAPAESVRRRRKSVHRLKLQVIRHTFSPGMHLELGSDYQTFIFEPGCVVCFSRPAISWTKSAAMSDGAPGMQAEAR
jgi:hypothetical protein